MLPAHMVSMFIIGRDCVFVDSRVLNICFKAGVSLYNHELGIQAWILDGYAAFDYDSLIYMNLE